MTDYATQELLYNPGEGIDTDDLNKVQRFLRSQIWDQVVGGRVRVQETADGMSSNLAYCYPAGGGAPVASSATVRTVTNTYGLLVKRRVGIVIAGSDAATLSQYVAPDAMATQLDIGDANPRIDRVMYRLRHVDNDAVDIEARIVRATTPPYAMSTGSPVKRRKVVLDMLVVKGTPAASPIPPSITSEMNAGYALWCEVLVPALHNAVIDIENMRDWRVPIGYDTHNVFCAGVGQNVSYSAGWTASGSSPGLVSTGSATAYVFPSARSRHSGRLVRLGIMGMLTGSTIQIVRVNNDNTTSFGGETVLQDVSAFFNVGANQLYETGAFTNPYWLNGFTAGIAAATSPKAPPNDARMTTLAIKITVPSSNKVLRFVDFGVAAA